MAVVLAVAGWVLAGPASAAPQDMFLQLTGGTVGVGDSSFELPGEGGFNGTWDDETGELTGTMDLPTVTTSVTAPAPADIVLTFSTIGDVTGTVDPDTGEAAVTASVRIGISVTLGGTTAPVTGPDCAVEPIELALTGTFDFAADALELSASGFTIPPSADCEPIGAIIDGFLAGDTTATLSFERVAEQVTTTTTSSTTTTSTTSTTEASSPTPQTPAAQPVQRPARFTG